MQFAVATGFHICRMRVSSVKFSSLLYRTLPAIMARCIAKRFGFSLRTKKVTGLNSVKIKLLFLMENLLELFSLGIKKHMSSILHSSKPYLLFRTRSSLFLLPAYYFFKWLSKNCMTVSGLFPKYILFIYICYVRLVVWCSCCVFRWI